MRYFVALFFALIGLAIPALAQTDPSDAWKQQRVQYLGQSTGSFDQRRSAYLQQNQGNLQSWWAAWKTDQPYDKGVTYSMAPHAQDVPADPGLVSDSAYGHNVAELVYGKPAPAARVPGAVPSGETHPTASMKDIMGQ